MARQFQVPVDLTPSAAAAIELHQHFQRIASAISGWAVRQDGNREFTDLLTNMDEMISDLDQRVVDFFNSNFQDKKPLTPIGS